VTRVVSPGSATQRDDSARGGRLGLPRRPWRRDHGRWDGSAPLGVQGTVWMTGLDTRALSSRSGVRPARCVRLLDRWAGSGMLPPSWRVGHPALSDPRILAARSGGRASVRASSERPLLRPSAVAQADSMRPDRMSTIHAMTRLGQRLVAAGYAALVRSAWRADPHRTGGGPDGHPRAPGSARIDREGAR